jgi:small GTP-binding protein
MGFLFSKVIELFSKSSNNFKIVILGLQNAGKTTILYRLSLGQLVSTQPTIGSNVEEISHNNVKFQAWDLGGQETMRSVWDVYYINTDAIIYVIDSADVDSYEESKVEFLKLMQHEELKLSTILIYANKQDLDSAKPISDLVSIYGLDKIKDKVWHIQPCSAKTGEGLMAGLKWLSEQLIYKKNTRFPKNPYLTSKRDKFIDLLIYF